VLSLQGTNPKDAKAPEGDVWVDENAPKADAKVDSTTTSTEVVMK
jgi:cytochrome c oxidase cbb3-type subunit 3